MFNMNTDAYDIQIATVDPRDWSILRVGIYNDVHDAIDNHPEGNGLGDWMEGGIEDVDFDGLPNYHAVELIRASDDPMMYLAMKGTDRQEFEKAIIEAVEYRKANPKRTKVELVGDVHRHIDKLIDDYIYATGKGDRDTMYNMVAFLLNELSTPGFPGSGEAGIPSFLLVPNITEADHQHDHRSGRRPYEQSPGNECSQYDILMGLTKMMPVPEREYTNVLGLYELDNQKVRQELTDDWERTIRSKICECFTEKVITKEQADTLPIEEVVTVLFQNAYPDPVSINLARWTTIMHIVHELDAVDFNVLTKEAARRRHADPKGGHSEGTSVKYIEALFADEYSKQMW